MADRANRIVWVAEFSNPRYKSNPSKYADALARMGVEVVRLDPPATSLEAELEQPTDLVIFGKCRDFPVDRLVSLTRRSIRPPMVQLLFDPMDYPERVIRGVPWPTRSTLHWWLPMARHFDAVLLKDRGLFDAYAESGIRCIYLDEAAEPIGCEPEERSDDEKYDVAFIGSRVDSRSRRFSEIAQGRFAAAFGGGWKRWQWKNRRIVACAPVYGDDFVTAVRSAKVIWAENRRHDVDGYWSDRVYRVLAAGGVFLTRFTPGLDEVFENGRHLVWYHDLEEARRLLDELLADGDFRRRLRVEGRALVEARHTYDHRARELLEITAGIRGRNG